MNRLEAKIKSLEKKGERAFVGFLPLMYPSEELMVKAFLELEKAGVDIIEIGFSDKPYMDGEVIKNAYNKARDDGTCCNDIFSIVKKIRKLSNLPIAFMTYKDDIENMINEGFKEAIISAGIEGMIIPDIDDELKLKIGFDESLLLIDVQAIGSDFDYKNISGFKYCVSNKGVTGNKELDVDFISESAKVFTKYKKRVFIGFGMGEFLNIKNLKEFFGGVIIGTEIIKVLSKNNIEEGTVFKVVKKYANEIKKKDSLS